MKNKNVQPLEVNQNQNSNESFYKQFFDEAPDMFASVDPNTAKIKSCNQTLINRLGYEQQYIIGMHLKEIYHPNSHAEMERLFQSFVECGRAECDRLQLITASGEIVDVSLRVSCHRDGDGKVIESRSVWRDVSLQMHVERLELELRLQKAQKMESLALLAGGIAHDFNNMLVPILGYASLCLLESSENTALNSKLKAIETAAQRAADLTKQLLAYSGSGNREQTYFDLSGVVKEMGHLLNLAISRDVCLNFDLAQNTCPVFGDVTQIRQVVMNLLSNGSDALGDRGGSITIRTGRQFVDADYLNASLASTDLHPGSFAFLEVSDTGKGMSKEEQRKMFDPFFTTKTDGHGLGLAAVLGIVTSHGGALRVFSEIDDGTTIKLFLPLKESATTEQSEKEVEVKGNGEHILVVDDDDSVRTVASQTLEHLGFKVSLACDGGEAVRKYALNPLMYDLVLMDMTMPLLDGVGAFEEISRLDPDAIIVFMSGHSRKQATDSLDKRTFGGFLQKPFRSESLQKVISDAMKTSSRAK